MGHLILHVWRRILLRGLCSEPSVVLSPAALLKRIKLQMVLKTLNVQLVDNRLHRMVINLVSDYSNNKKRPFGRFFYTNKSFTNWACSVIKRNLNSGFLPISSVTIVRVFSVSSAPSSVRGGNSTRIRRRVFGDMVVSFN